MARITRVMRALVRLVMAADASGEVRSTEPDLCVDGLRGGRVHMRGLRTSVAILTATITISLALTSAPASASGLSLVLRTLDGSQNNLTHPSWGQAGTQYLRVGHANYADGISAMVSGPSPRYVSNRVFNDRGQNIFSEGGVTNWGWVWGQFLDHDIGLRDETSTGSAALPFNAGDPLESFRNDFGAISFSRTPAAPGTGVATPRQQINTISSYIDASNVYGTTKDRLLWLRAGPLAPGATPGAALMLTTDGYLPRRSARGDDASAPPMDLMGALLATPDRAVVAGDVRANENSALTMMHTLFAREHNRIVAALPDWLSAEEKFQIARRVIGAEVQRITYAEFLPALGVRLAPYHGYDPRENAGLANEFAAVGYRAHSMIHGEFEPFVPAARYSAAQLEAFEAMGIEVELDGSNVKLRIPLNVAFGNPDLLEQVGIDAFVTGLGERQYRNDEQIDNTLRSVLFQVPRPGVDPASCGGPVVLPECFSVVSDLGAIDIQRARDHGMPRYNDMRRAYGLAPKGSFTAITGEATQQFPTDPLITGDPIDDPEILDFTLLLDADGHVVTPGTPEALDAVVVGVRRTTLAARLKAIYGDVNSVDAFVGMMSEKHLKGAEFGELQLAIWKKQFEVLRDGDRFFYQVDPALPLIDAFFGIDYRHTLSDIVRLNAGLTLPANVFLFTGD
ncbi:MAG: peroxidase [Chloroflexi bacterium]|nr:MAG: peroxidase [Chloroflexota bacterium]